MDKIEKLTTKEEIYSRKVRAGKRTYFFDVKQTKSNDYYLTITESKKKFTDEKGNFFYEKHKVFLYKEDLHKFQNSLSDVIDFIEAKIGQEKEVDEEINLDRHLDKHLAVDFSDL